MKADIEQPYGGGFVGNAHHFALRVYIEDTDLAGVVYYANYLRFLERARSDLLRLLNIDQRAALESRKGVYTVTEVHIKYRQPARLADELLIVSKLDAIRSASCTLSQEILRGSDLIAHATVNVAFLTPEGRPARHPPEWLLKFQRLQAKTD